MFGFTELNDSCPDRRIGDNDDIHAVVSLVKAMPMRSKTTDSRFRRADQATTEAPPLIDLLGRAEWLANLDRRVRLQLPADLAGGLVIANVRQDTLVVTTAHPALARRARLEQKRILEAANRFLTPPLKTLTVKVTPPTADPLISTVSTPPSETAIEHLRLAALALGDAEMAAAFASLSQKR